MPCTMCISSLIVVNKVKKESEANAQQPSKNKQANKRNCFYTFHITMKYLLIVAFQIQFLFASRNWHCNWRWVTLQFPIHIQRNSVNKHLLLGINKCFTNENCDQYNISCEIALKIVKFLNEKSIWVWFQIAITIHDSTWDTFKCIKWVWFHLVATLKQ